MGTYSEYGPAPRAVNISPGVQEPKRQSYREAIVSGGVRAETEPDFPRRARPPYVIRTRMAIQNSSDRY
jgi:hypothetical protein